MSNNECHFVTEPLARRSQILQFFSNLSKYICLICLDLRDFSPQATKYQRFRILRNLSMPFLLTKNHIDKRHHVADIHSPIAVHIVPPLVKHTIIFEPPCRATVSWLFTIEPIASCPSISTCLNSQSSSGWKTKVLSSPS